MARRYGIQWVGDFVQVGRDVVHYRAAGDGPAVVLIHGLLAWSYTWRHNLEALAAAADVRVYALDLRGFGLSSRPRRGFHLGAQAELVLGFMATLGIARAALVGHSMGGEIALRMALEAPDQVSGLVLVASAGLFRASLPPGLRFALGLPGAGVVLARTLFMRRRFAQSMLAEAYGDPGRVTPETVHHYLFPARLPGSARALVHMARELDFGATADRLGEIRQPALLVWGDRDPWVPPAWGERLARILPRAEWHLVPGAGHLPHEEYPDRFNAVAGRWLRDHLHGAA